MAKAKSVSGPKLLILVGDGDNPEEFAHPCTINAARGFSVTANTSDSNVPDCDEPETPPWIEREQSGKSATISGAGTLHAPDQALFFAWLESGEAKNVKVMTNVSAENGGYVYTAAYLCTQFDITGDFGAKIQANITLVSSGPVVQAPTTAAAPSAFASSGWSVAAGDAKAVVSISSLPNEGSAAITDIEYRINGGAWTSSGGIVGFDTSALTNDVAYGISIRAVNSAGAGPASDVKFVTPTD